MSGISIVAEIKGFEQVLKKYKHIFAFEPSELMSTLGALGESQTRRRISDEKTAPDGTAWQPNTQGTSILVESGQHLLSSVAWTSSATEAEWGATWEHAHVHQEGMVIVPKNAGALVFELAGRTIHAKSATIPARAFVGISTDNEAEIMDVLSDYFGVVQ